MPSGRTAIDVFVTVGSRADADRIASAVVAGRLAACVNVWPISSTFRWQRSVRRVREYALLMKTTVRRFAALERRIRALHPDTIPCIIAVPIKKGYAPYLRWIDDMTHA